MCPPLSDSTVMSSATLMSRASPASSGVSLPALSSASTMATGAGPMKADATSGREIFAMTWLRATTDPSGPRFTPVSRYCTSMGVRAMKAAASMTVTPCFRYRSTTPCSMRGSDGEWMRLKQDGPSGSAAFTRRMASSTRSKDSPAAPKLPSIPARPMAMTMSVVAMPLAMAPVM